VLLHRGNDACIIANVPMFVSLDVLFDVDTHLYILTKVTMNCAKKICAASPSHITARQYQVVL